MTANQDAAQAVLTTLGIPDTDMPDALAATESVVRVFNLQGGELLPEQWECAAEFVGTFAAITGVSGAGLRQVSSLARPAYKLQRF